MSFDDRPKDLRQLRSPLLERVVAAIDSLSVDPRRPGSRKLAGRAGRLRIRVGDYRILYALDQKRQVVVVHNVKHRREAYRS